MYKMYYLKKSKEFEYKIHSYFNSLFVLNPCPISRYVITEKKANTLFFSYILIYFSDNMGSFLIG